MQEDMTVEDFVNLEEQIDEERNRISKHGRPVSETNYNEWRANRDIRRLKLRTEKERLLAGKTTGIQLFKNSNMEIQDDEGAADIKIDENLFVEDVETDILDKDEFFKYESKDDGILRLII
jgi:hypothetical protein